MTEVWGPCGRGYKGATTGRAIVLMVMHRTGWAEAFQPAAVTAQIDDAWRNHVASLSVIAPVFNRHADIVPLFKARGRALQP